MITVCSRWENLQMSPSLEWRMWRQLRGAFNIDRFVFTPRLPEMENFKFDQFDSMQQALDSCKGLRVFLEPEGRHEISDLVKIKDQDIVLVLGNTELGNSKYVEDEDLSVRIKTPKTTDLYGINAATVALAYRYGQ